ncbi:MAG: copper chaperone PCu(A)C [Panacagrimonas sp.]
MMSRFRGPAVAVLVLAAGLLVSLVRAERDAGVRVTDAWARSSVPGSDVGAVYATFHNDSGVPLTVLAASSDAATSAAIHEVTTHSGVVHMHTLDAGLSIEAGATARLEPGGRHLMLLGLQRPLKPGQSLEVRFRISDGNEITVTVPVKDSDS